VRRPGAFAIEVRHQRKRSACGYTGEEHQAQRDQAFSQRYAAKRLCRQPQG